MISSSSLLSGLVEAAGRSLLVAAAVGAGLAALRMRNVVAQKAAWILVLGAAMLMPVLAPWASHATWVPQQAILQIPRLAWPLRQVASTAGLKSADRIAVTQGPLQSAPAEPAPAAHHEFGAPASLAGTRFPAPAISHVSSDTAYVPPGPAPKPGRISISVADITLLLYVVVCAVLLGRVAWGAWTAMRLWLRSEPVGLALPAAAPGLRLRASRDIASPVTVGSGIVLPEDYTEWDAEKLQIVVAHEASHVRQCDFYLQLWVSLYMAAFWFSPLGWWIKRKLSDLSETISDRAAVDHAASHASYAQVLLEFAALPHPLPTGVAMARQGRLVSRIERLLNESSFRQAFAGGRARIAAAVLLVPAALFAATALVRVQARVEAAAQASDQQAPAAPPKMDAPPPPPAIAAVPVAPAPAGQAPAAPSAPAIAPVLPAAPVSPAVAPPPPAAEDAVEFPAGGSSSLSASQSDSIAGGSDRSGSSYSGGKGYAYSYQRNGDSYALISGKDNVTFSGDWYGGRKAELDKARRMAHGDFLWFTRNGKSYVMDDPQTIAQIKAMYAPMETLGRQQEELGHQQEELGKKQEALGQRQEQASAPAPEMTREIAEVEKATAALKAAKGQALTQDKLADMQEKLADLQSRLADLQGEIGEKQGSLGAEQGKLGELQGKLGEQQGKLGEQQGRLAVEADKKVKSIIDESLKNGKARPVQ